MNIHNIKTGDVGILLEDSLLPNEKNLVIKLRANKTPDNEIAEQIISSRESREHLTLEQIEYGIDHAIRR